MKKEIKVIVSLLSMVISLPLVSCNPEPDANTNPLVGKSFMYQDTFYLVNEGTWDSIKVYERRTLTFQTIDSGTDIEHDSSEYFSDKCGDYFKYTYENHHGSIIISCGEAIFNYKYTYNPDNKTILYDECLFSEVTE